MPPSGPFRPSSSLRRPPKRTAAEAEVISDADVEDSASASRPARRQRTTAPRGFTSRRQSDQIFLSSSASPPPSTPGDEEPPSGTTSQPSGAASRPSGTTSQATEEVEIITIDDLDSASEQENPEADAVATALAKQRAEQVASQKAASETAGQKMSGVQCVICMDAFEDMTATACGHIFCYSCLLTALKASEARRATQTGVHSKRSQCPVCRKTLDRSKGRDIIPVALKVGLATQPRRKRVSG